MVSAFLHTCNQTHPKFSHTNMKEHTWNHYKYGSENVTYTEADLQFSMPAEIICAGASVHIFVKHHTVVLLLFLTYTFCKAWFLKVFQNKTRCVDGILHIII